MQQTCEGNSGERQSKLLPHVQVESIPYMLMMRCLIGLSAERASTVIDDGATDKHWQDLAVLLEEEVECIPGHSLRCVGT